MKLASWWDRFTLQIAPRWTLDRVRARATIDLAQRHYEAAAPGRRTDGWRRNAGDADLNLRGALLELRMHARDLVRNNGWARRAQRVIANNTAGWGISAKPLTTDAALAAKAADLWKAWAGSKECDADNRHNFAGIQHLAMKSIAESGEILMRRRWRRPTDGLTIPLQLQVLEADFLDQNRNFLATGKTGPTIQGVEYDQIGRRTGYWIYDQHPGSGRNYTPSHWVPESEIIHVYYTERPGQSRGVSWFAPAILKLKDFDEYEDATLMRQKIAACFAAFVTEPDGTPGGLGVPDATNPLVESFEPGMIQHLPPGKEIAFASPPTVIDSGFDARTLRWIAQAIGITYEEMTGDYSHVNFSSARMARIAHWANVHDWRWNMLIPLLCDGVWGWAMEAAAVAGEIPDSEIAAEWTCPPMPMIEPDKEGLAYSRLVRNGMLTHDEMVREQGGDPESHWAQYAEGLKKLDALGIVLDSDPRKTTAAGQEQQSTTAEATAELSPAEAKAQRALLEILK